MNTKGYYICEVCGYKSLKWLGRCPNCLQYSTFLTEDNRESPQEFEFIKSFNASVVKVSEISVKEEKRLSTKFEEFDRVLGGGIVPGSVVLIGGEPGVGKSTLLLQAADKLSNYGNVLYVSSEEAINQLKLRIDRLGITSSHLFLLSEINIENILSQVDNINPKVIIIDSIQTLYSPKVIGIVGSITQVREAATRLLHLAKSKNISIFIVGHLTKEGVIAGPKLLEHMVDTVLYLENLNYQPYRLLRATKNRFGSTNEIGIFELKENGFDELSSPSLLFLESRRVLPGSVITSTIEGTRPLLIEVQALVTKSFLAIPRREIIGADYRRCMLILAVCEKILKINLSSYDVFINIVGGISVKEPACDLAILTAIISSYKEKTIPEDVVVLGEVGLTGEVRNVSFINNRLKEAKKLGFKTFYIPKINEKDLKEKIYNIHNISSVEEILFKFFK